MKHLTALVLLTSIILACASQLTIKQISINSTELAPGDETKMFVVFKSSQKNVAQVTATVREASEIYYSFNDDGKEGDEKAGDNIWTCNVEVPWNAPAGNYHLDITAEDKDDNPIFIEKTKQKSKDKGMTIEVTVN